MLGTSERKVWRVMSKKKDDLPVVVLIRDRLLYCIVCSSIPPDRVEDKLMGAMIAEGLVDNGTSQGWRLPTEEFYDEQPEARPLPCSDYENRWHYVLTC